MLRAGPSLQLLTKNGVDLKKVFEIYMFSAVKGILINLKIQTTIHKEMSWHVDLSKEDLYDICRGRDGNNLNLLANNINIQMHWCFVVVVLISLEKKKQSIFPNSHIISVICWKYMDISSIYQTNATHTLSCIYSCTIFSNNVEMAHIVSSDVCVLLGKGICVFSLI